jgi:hypothetical protein
MVRTPVQTNYMCDCPNRLHIDVVGTAGGDYEVWELENLMSTFFAIF